jgi:hypothetical protein
MKSRFSKQYPEFASIEKHIRRAHAERSVAIATWIAEAILGAAGAVRKLVSRAPAPARRGRLVVRVSAPR